MFNIIVATALVLVTTAVYGAEINTGSDNELRLGISSTSNLFAEQSYRLAEWELGTLQTGQRFTGTIGLVSPIDLQAPWLQSDPGLELEIYAAPSGSTGSKYGVRADLYRDSIVGDIVYRYEGFQIFAGYRIAGEGGEARGGIGYALFLHGSGPSLEHGPIVFDRLVYDVHFFSAIPEPEIGRAHV